MCVGVSRLVLLYLELYACENPAKTDFWLGLMLLFFGFVGFFANKKPIITFSEDGIEYPSFPIKKYAWADVVQVLWKDDILTIDLKDNKLLQFNMDKAFAEGVDVVGFNEFCKSKT